MLTGGLPPPIAPFLPLAFSEQRAQCFLFSLPPQVPPLMSLLLLLTFFQLLVSSIPGTLFAPSVFIILEYIVHVRSIIKTCVYNFLYTDSLHDGLVL